MAKFLDLVQNGVNASKSGQKLGGDKAPIVRATVVKNGFRLNGLMGKKLNVATGDNVQFFTLGGGKYFAIAKEVSGSDEARSAKLSGQDKNNTTVGTQSLSFTYAGMYTYMMNDAATKLDFDATQRVEVKFKIADELDNETLLEYIPEGEFTGELEQGGTAFLLEAVDFVVKPGRANKEDEEDQEEDQE